MMGGQSNTYTVSLQLLANGMLQMLSQVQRQTLAVRAAMAQMSASIEAAAAASTALVGALGAIAVGLAGVVGLGVKLAADMEQARIGFETMLGSAQAAEEFLQRLRAFANQTPFEFPELRDAAQRFLAFGFEADRVIPILRSVGDAVAALGGGSEKINRVTMALGQLQAKGRVQAEELLQLTEAGIPAWQILSEKIGVTTAELMKMVEKGVVPAGPAIDALVEGMNERFGGMMARQATSLAGLFSTLKDTARDALTTVGEQITTTFDLRAVITAAIGWVTQFRDYLQKGGMQQALQNIRASFQNIAGVIVGLLLPLLAQTATAIAAMVLRLTPWIIAGTVLVQVMSELGTTMADVRKFVMLAIQAFAGFGSILSGLVENVRGVVRFWTTAFSGVVRTISLVIGNLEQAKAQVEAWDFSGAAATMQTAYDNLGRGIGAAFERGTAAAQTAFDRSYEQISAGIAQMGRAFAGEVDKGVPDVVAIVTNAITKAKTALRDLEAQARSSASAVGTSTASGLAGQLAKTSEKAEEGASQIEILNARFRDGKINLQQYHDALYALVLQQRRQLDSLKEGSPEWKKLNGEVNSSLAALNGAREQIRKLAEATRSRDLENYSRNLRLMTDGQLVQAATTARLQRETWKLGAIYQEVTRRSELAAKAQKDQTAAYQQWQEALARGREGDIVASLGVGAIQDALESIERYGFAALPEAAAQAATAAVERIRETLAANLSTISEPTKKALQQLIEAWEEAGADAANKLLEGAEKALTSRFADGLQFTLDLIQRQYGAFTSIEDALGKIAKAEKDWGVQIALNLDQYLALKERLTEVKEAVASIAQTTEANPFDFLGNATDGALEGLQVGLESTKAFFEATSEGGEELLALLDQTATDAEALAALLVAEGKYSEAAGVLRYSRQLRGEWLELAKVVRPTIEAMEMPDLGLEQAQADLEEFRRASQEAFDPEGASPERLEQEIQGLLSALAALQAIQQQFQAAGRFDLAAGADADVRKIRSQIEELAAALLDLRAASISVSVEADVEADFSGLQEQALAVLDQAAMAGAANLSGAALDVLSQLIESLGNAAAQGQLPEWLTDLLERLQAVKAEFEAGVFAALDADAQSASSSVLNLLEPLERVRAEVAEVESAFSRVQLEFDLSGDAVASGEAVDVLLQRLGELWTAADVDGKRAIMGIARQLEEFRDSLSTTSDDSQRATQRLETLKIAVDGASELYAAGAIALEEFRRAVAAQLSELEDLANELEVGSAAWLAYQRQIQEAKKVLADTSPMRGWAEAFGQAASALKDSGDEVLASVSALVRGVGQMLQKAATGDWLSAIGLFAAGLAEALGGAKDDAVQIVGTMVDVVSSTIMGLASGGPIGALVGFVTSVFAGIVKWINEAKRKAEELAESIKASQERVADTLLDNAERALKLDFDKGLIGFEEYQQRLYELQLQRLQQAENAELEALRRMFEQGKLSREQYEAELAAIQEKYRLSREEAELEMQKRLADAAKAEAERIKSQALSAFSGLGNLIGQLLAGEINLRQFEREFGKQMRQTLIAQVQQAILEAAIMASGLAPLLEAFKQALAAGDIDLANQLMGQIAAAGQAAMATATDWVKRFQDAIKNYGKPGYQPPTPPAPAPGQPTPGTGEGEPGAQPKQGTGAPPGSKTTQPVKKAPVAGSTESPSELLPPLTNALQELANGLPQFASAASEFLAGLQTLNLPDFGRMNVAISDFSDAVAEFRLGAADVRIGGAAIERAARTFEDSVRRPRGPVRFDARG